MRRELNLRRMVIAICLLTGGCAPYQTLSKKETVTFQPSSCYQLPDGGGWSVTLRGEIYHRSFLNRIEPDIVHIMEAHKIITAGEEAETFDKRLAPFLDDHVRGMTLGALIGNRIQPLTPSDSSGRLKEQVVISDEEVAMLEATPDEKGGPHWITLTVVQSKSDCRQFPWRVQVVPPRGWTVVSDIDDTIKITDVNNTKEMLRHTFILPLEVMPGMPEVYQQWAKEKHAAFFYLSESSVELCTPLSEFLLAAGYPEGSIDLREIAWGHHRLRGFMSMMDAPPEYKVTELKRIINNFPERDYVLVGDSSQHDPEVYAETARSFPKQVRRILIHDVTCQSAQAPRYQKTFHDLPRDLWQIFREPTEIKDAFPAGGA